MTMAELTKQEAETAESGTKSLSDILQEPEPVKLTWKEKRSNKKKEKEKQRFTKKKFPIVRVILAVVVVGVGVYLYFSMSKNKDVGTPVPIVPLEKGDLVSSVNLTGVVYSAEDASVYAKTTGMIQTVKVKLGDRVEAGQVLAQLDTSDIAMQIAEKEAQIAQTQRLQEFALRSSEKDFDAGRVDVAAGLNANLIAAENSVDRAQKNLNAARHDFNESREDRELADTMFKKAQQDLERASDAYWKAKVELEEAGTPAPPALVEAYNKAEAAFETAKDKYNDIDREYGKEMSTEAKNYRDARSDYEKALLDRDAAKNAVARQLDGLRDDVEKAELNMDFTADYLAIEQMRSKIDDSVVVAPISGTVTAVEAKVGTSATGVLFVIEDTENLIIKTAVKEMDIGKVKPEMKATVKADATGEKVFPGEVLMISPTAVKDDTGKTKTGGNVEFETDVALEEKGTELRVGMNVRVNVVTEEQKAVWYVPFDAVVSDADGNARILIAEADATGVLRAKMIPVTTGLETDFYIAVSGDALKEDTQVISDPAMVEEGMIVRNANAAMLQGDTAATDGAAASSEDNVASSEGATASDQSDDASSESAAASGDTGSSAAEG